MAYSVLRRICTSRKFGQLQINPIIAFFSSNKTSTGFQPLLQTENLIKHCQNNLQPAEDGYRNAQRILSSYDADLFSLIESDIKDIHVDIIKELSQHTNNSELLSAATYYLNGRGKAGAPMAIILMARAINYHMKRADFLPSQRQIALVVEMIYAMALAQDDVCDIAEIRRGQPSINVMWNYKQVVMAGNYVVAVAIIMAARLRNDDATLLISKLVSEVIHGELIQAEMSKEELNEAENKHITRYLNMISLKTASIIANSFKAITVLAGADEELSETAFQYGRNIGLGAQLMDDYLDFASTTEIRGKATGVDLKLGLANAPVLFACEEFPELSEMIMRKFEDEGDVEKAFEMVHKSKGLEQTQLLAKKYCLEAVRLVSSIKESPYQKGLTIIPHIFVNRK